MECGAQRTLLFIGVLSTAIFVFKINFSKGSILSILNSEVTNNAHHTKCSKSSFLASSMFRDNPRDNIMTSSDVRKYQKARIKNIRRVCGNKTVFKKAMYKDRLSLRFYFSPRYKFTYCKVPKSGSTFWSQVFEILHNNGNVSAFLTKGRSTIHEKMYKYYSHLSYQYMIRHPAVIPTRNPFSRLFSGFVDKSYLNLMPKLNNNIRREFLHETHLDQNDTVCHLDVTFQEFLDFIVRQTQYGRKLDRHWAPVYSLCMPCNLNVATVVKHETNRQDVIFALDELGVQDDVADDVIALMNENRINTTIPGIIKTAYNRVQNDCMSRIELVRRIWTAFQYQGFVRHNIPFPDHVINDVTADDMNHVIRTVLETIKRHPMSSAEVHTQRRHALVDAYCDISAETIEEIKNIYKLDFELFDYTLNPPR